MRSASGWCPNKPLLLADSATAIAADELEALLAPLKHRRLVALAVSGGVDSMALLDCADRWRQTHTDTDFIVLTVDHRLRRESADEAEMVAAAAANRGLSSRVLVWNGARPRSDIEGVAREARYRLLIKAARDAGASHLLLAHHRDDVAEGFLIRLARGSGVFGLAAMRPLIDVGSIVIFRPFLTVAKARLAATTRAAGLESADDPMNKDSRFTRARVRELLRGLGDEGMEAADLAAAAHRLADAADAIDTAASEIIGRAVMVDELAIGRLDPKVFRTAPKAVRYRALGRVLMAVGGETREPRFERLKRLGEAIDLDSTSWKRCLGGTVIERRAGEVLLYRENVRGGLPQLPLSSGLDREWDRRFRIRVTGQVPDDAVLGPLSEDGRQQIGAQGASPAALAALPAVRSAGLVIAVPLLGFAEGPPIPLQLNQIVSIRLRQPPLFPDFTAGP